MKDAFALRAAGWDTPKRIARAEIIAARIEQEIAGQGYRRALEFGCGTGLIGLNLLGAFDHITLMDASAAMVDTLREKLAASGISCATPVLRNIETEEYPRTFDCVYSSMVLHHIRDYRRVLRKLYGLLNPGGMLCIVDLDKEDGRFHDGDAGFDGHDGFARDEMMAEMRAAGFAHIAMETFYRDEKNVRGERVPYSLFCLSGRKGAD